MCLVRCSQDHAEGGMQDLEGQDVGGDVKRCVAGQNV